MRRRTRGNDSFPWWVSSLRFCEGVGGEGERRERGAGRQVSDVPAGGLVCLNFWGGIAERVAGGEGQEGGHPVRTRFAGCIVFRLLRKWCKWEYFRHDRPH